MYQNHIELKSRTWAKMWKKCIQEKILLYVLKYEIKMNEITLMLCFPVKSKYYYYLSETMHCSYIVQK